MSVVSLRQQGASMISPSKTVGTIVWPRLLGLRSQGRGEEGTGRKRGANPVPEMDQPPAWITSSAYEQEERDR